MVEEEKIKCSKEEEYIRKQVFFSLSAHLVTIIIRQLVRLLTQSHFTNTMRRFTKTGFVPVYLINSYVRKTAFNEFQLPSVRTIQKFVY